MIHMSRGIAAVIMIVATAASVTVTSYASAKADSGASVRRTPSTCQNNGATWGCGAKFFDGSAVCGADPGVIVAPTKLTLTHGQCHCNTAHEPVLCEEQTQCSISYSFQIGVNPTYHVWVGGVDKGQNFNTGPCTVGACNGTAGDSITIKDTNGIVQCTFSVGVGCNSCVGFSCGPP
jgi:hypothetical protein